jgi:glycosyltransferase involved in cell wall biosynthesis
MIRVASLVSYKITPAKMGGQKSIYLFLKYLSAYCKVVCYTTRNNEPAENEPFLIKKILSNHKVRYINPFYFFRLKKELKKDAITHLLIEHPYYGWLAILLKKAMGLKLILRSQNVEAMRFRSTGKWWWQIMSWYEGWAHRAADLNLFITAEDMDYSISKYGLKKEKCTVSTYGTEKSKSPSRDEKGAAKKEVCRQHNIDENNLLLLYNGTLDYFPNKKGLDCILQEINPLLLENKSLRYTILICGNRLPQEYNDLKDYNDRNIIYAGFVNDIDSYFRAADIFINPVAYGGGIKTKLVEALAAGCSAVSFDNGAIGILIAVTGNKFRVVPDHDVKAFAENIAHLLPTIKEDMPAAFFDHFYWDSIAKRAASDLEKL